MDSNLESINQELNALSGDLKAFEGQLMPQLDELARTIPEIYSGYASMVHDLVDNTLTLFNTSNRTRYKVAVAAEIGAKAIEAFGEYKAAKEHNRLLQKYMKVNREGQPSSSQDYQKPECHGQAFQPLRRDRIRP